MICIDSNSVIDDWDDSDFLSEDMLDNDLDEGKETSGSFLCHPIDIHDADSFVDLTNTMHWEPDGQYIRSENESQLIEDNSLATQSFHTSSLLDFLDILEEEMLNNGRE